MSGGHPLIQIVDAALAEAVRKAGHWLACRPGCFECCLGPFPITPLDADLLRRGLAEADPELAARVLARARAYQGAEDEPCPVLDPAAGTCDLYAARPITCRVFGPALRQSGGPLGVCELCFAGATDEEIAACAVDLEIEEPDGEMTVAEALLLP